MTNNLLFDISIDKENKTINIKREFDANISFVWKCWTTAELLDQWWAPSPYQNRTKSMDFSEGGKWHYSMISPEGEIFWGIMLYQIILFEKSFTSIAAFCNENAEINNSFPQNLWKTDFSANNEYTLVEITRTFDKLEYLEQLIQMGFLEGLTAGLNQLEELLNNQKKEML